MRASAYVGRVGGLAVALGIGMAVGGTGVAWAAPADGSGPDASASASRSPASSAAGSTTRPRGGRSAPPTGAAAGGGTPAALSSLSTGTSLPRGGADRTGLASRAATAESEPEVPADVPEPLAAAAMSTDRAGKAVASATAPTFDQIIQYTLFHRSATANPVQNPGQSSNGTVTGSLNAQSDNGAAITYTLAEAPSTGTVLLGQDGSYAYTPDAGLAATGGYVSFGVAVDNGGPDYRLSGIGGAIQGILMSLAQLIGLRQPDVVTVTVPVSIVGNSAPLIGVPTIGLPDTITGLVTGQINATDPEGGTLSYGGSTNTVKGRVNIDPLTGAFTYTPNPSSRGIAAGTDTFIATVTDIYGAAASVGVTVPVAAWVATNSQIRYTFNYGSGAEYWSADARRALQFAADRIASYIVVSQPVMLTFDLTGNVSSDSTTLASAGSNLAGFGFGYFYTVVQNKILRGDDFNGSSADGVINVNFNTPWSYDDDLSFGEYDFASVIMHEMMHAYGFTTAVDEPGSNTRRSWPLFDSGIYDGYGNKLIDTDNLYRFNTALDANLTGGNDGLYFAGANAVNAYGGLVPLYTPSPFDSGSSVSHLGDYAFLAPQLMDPSIAAGTSIRMLSPTERGILSDIGYSVQNPIWASVLFVGFLFIRRRR